MCPARRRSLEIIFWKLLQFPKRPALVYLHFWAPTYNIGQWSFWNHTVQPGEPHTSQTSPGQQGATG